MSANEGSEIIEAATGSGVAQNGIPHEAVVMTIDVEEGIRKELYSKMKAAKLLFLDRVRFLISSDSSGTFGKKTKKFAKKLSNRGIGKLRGIVSLPLDVICEVAMHLQPLDLLQISRVNKDFASLFLTPKTRSVWRNVLKHAYHDLPQCPLDMTEPQYASLVLEKFCMACGHTRIHFTSFSLRVRLCSTCEKENIITGFMVKRLHLDHLWRILPSHCKYYYSGDRLTMIENKDLYNSNKFLYIKGEVEDAGKFPRDASSDSLVALIIEITKSGDRISAWLNALQKREDAQSKAAGKARTQIIFQKIKELGWEPRYYPQDYDYDPLTADWKRAIYQDKPFNEKGWKITKTKLEAIYLKSKRKRIAADLEEKLKNRYYKFWSSLDTQDKETMPGWEDVKYIPCLADVLKNCPNDDIPEEEWAILCPKILEEVEPIKTRIRGLIIAQVKKNKPSLFKPGNSHSDDLMVLRRACCLFLCTCGDCYDRGRSIRPYPNIVKHNTNSYRNWSITSQDFDSNISDLAEAILKALGFSPDIQREELTVFENKFVCRCGCWSCESPLSFEQLVSHVHSEQNWYNQISRYIKQSKIEKAATLLINDHDPSCLPELVCIINPADPSTQPRSCYRDSSSEKTNNSSFNGHFGEYCRYCYEVTYEYERVQDVHYHMKAKHGKEYTAEDLMTENALMSTYNGPSFADSDSQRIYWDDY